MLDSTGIIQNINEGVEYNRIEDQVSNQYNLV